jgi:hypothetical protein
MSNHFAKLVLCLCALTVTAFAQQSHWAATDDPTAKYIIESERQWAESGCDFNNIEAKIMADDFQGTSPRDGSRYSKAETLAQNADKSQAETDCRLLDAKVRFFSSGDADSVAMVYGSETATRKDKSGKSVPHCLTWTDTWLKRDGKWQIIAAQDAQFPCK